jgi:hypothetical protein
MEIKENSLSVKDIVKMIDHNIHFSFSRWGDGEFHAILRTAATENCDGHRIDAELGEALGKILTDRNSYMFGILNITKKVHGESLLEYLKSVGLEDMVWYDGDCLLNASCIGELYPFIESIRKKKVIYVGPDYMNNLGRVFPNGYSYFEVPRVDAFYDRYELTFKLMDKIGAVGPDVILFSAGFVTKYMIDFLYMYYGKYLSMIDMGSIMDPYVGMYNRTHSKYKDWSKLMPINLGEKVEPAHLFSLTPGVLSKHPNYYFVETGTFKGDGIDVALYCDFKHMSSIEIHHPYVVECRRKFEYNHNVFIHEGDSANLLYKVVKKLNPKKQITFWLDSHIHRADTIGETKTPLILELKQIALLERKDHTILIDDVRLMGTEEWSDVTKEAVIEQILKINPNYKISYDGELRGPDIMVAEII